MKHSYKFHRSLYLQLIGFIFFIAFSSYYVQFPGLLSSSGITPVDRILPYAFPQIHEKFIASNLIPEWDILCQGVAVLGMAISLAVCCGIVNHGFVFFILTIQYYFLVVSGQNFFSFQWDILLLEVGMATSLCYCEWTDFRLNTRMYRQNKEHMNSMGVWPLRFLLFKLMFMSGVVKLQAQCPTWLNLTALEYHFATQPLPGPLAWHAHQLHPFFLRLSIAATLLIEIPLAFLLLAPSQCTRCLGARLQVLLQIMIFCSGNYNFFNLLTVVLCIPCFEDEGAGDVQVKNYAAGRMVLRKIITLAFVFYCAVKMFRLQKVATPQHEHDLSIDYNVSLTLTAEDLTSIIDVGVPCAIVAVNLFIINMFIRQQFNDLSPNHRLHNVDVILRAPACALYIFVMAAPMKSLTPHLQNHWMLNISKLDPLVRVSQTYHVANGYGLFRRMTGVAQHNYRAGAEQWGTSGLPPSIVARPEIILEGIFDDNQWYEIEFRWKPGANNVLPHQVAPHQPRLDWQMWFAALGNYQHNPWLINLMDKILEGCGPVMNLLGDSRLAAGHVPSKVRARLYHYDFTRLNTTWARRIPNTSIEASKESSDDDTGTSLWADFFRFPDNYWTRTYMREYTMAIEGNNTSVTAFLDHYRYQRRCDRTKRWV